MILTAALNLRWHKACKKELSVSFIISKKVPLEAEEWPCSAELTYAIGLMVELCWREAHGNITTPEAGPAVTINQGHQNHASHSFKSSKNDLKKKTFWELAYCLSLLVFKEITAWLKYPLRRPLERLLCTQRPRECRGHWRRMRVTGFVPENLTGKFIMDSVSLT